MRERRGTALKLMFIVSVLLRWGERDTSSPLAAFVQILVVTHRYWPTATAWALCTVFPQLTARALKRFAEFTGLSVTFLC